MTDQTEKLNEITTMIQDRVNERARLTARGAVDRARIAAEAAYQRELASFLGDYAATLVRIHAINDDKIHKAAIEAIANKEMQKIVDAMLGENRTLALEPQK